MRIIFAAKKIELTKSEMKAAECCGSAAYNALMNVRRDNPGFEVVEIKVKKSRSPLDKLNMATMKAYVKAHGSTEQKTEFVKLSVAQYTEDGIFIPARSTFEVKKWFLAEFPKYKESVESREREMAELFDAIDKKIEAAKVEAAKKAVDEAKKEAEEYLKAS